MKRILASPPAAVLAFTSALLLISFSGCSTLPSTPAGIDPDAKAILQQASDTLAAADSFSFRVQRKVPAVIAEKSGMSEEADIHVSAQRPNKVMAIDQAGGHERCFYYDGSQITRHGGPRNIHAIAAAPATTDEMIPFLKKEWGVHPPLAGLLLSKPFEGAIQKAQSGTLIGEETIDGELCHHLQFTGDGVLWDFWFSAADHLPRRFDVTITELSGSPKGETKISGWNLDAKFPEDHFRAKIPAGSTPRPMVELN